MTASSALAWLLDLAARTTLPLAGALIAVHFMRSHSAARRHAVALAGLVVAVWILGMAVALPGAGAWIAGVDGNVRADEPGLGVDPRAFFTASAMGKEQTLGTSPAASPASSRLPYVPLAIWSLVMVILLVRVVHGVAGAWRLQRRLCPVFHVRLNRHLRASANQLGMRKTPRLLIAPEGLTAMAWGPPGAYVVLPPAAASWDDERLHATLVHELAHIRRLDAPTQALARMLCAVLWFHPLTWWLRASLVHDQEQACDDHVLGAGVRKAGYARHLFDSLAEPAEPGGRWPLTAGVSLGGPSRWRASGRRAVAARIRRLLDTGIRREPIGRRLSLAVMGLAAIMGTGLVFGPALLAPAWGSPTEEAVDEKEAPPVLDRASAADVLEPIREMMAEREIPGAVVALVKDGKVLLSRGFGVADVETGQAVDVERTVFRLGSITKAITAIALLQSLDEHGISLDHAIEALTPGLAVPSVGDQPVTARHLLTHTAGFDQLGYGRHAGAAYELLPLQVFLGDHLVADRPPGSVSTYDTYGITLAGHVVERLTGTTYSEAVTANVFRRLGLHHSGFHVPGATDQQLAKGYAGRGGQLRPQRWEFHHTVPASSANSTGGDMARLMIALLDDCQRDGKRLLSPSTCRAMLRQQFENEPGLPGYGFGFFTEQRGDLQVAHHGGNMEGYIALLYLLPDENVGLFVAANREDGYFTERVKQWLLDRFYPQATPTAATQIAATQTAETDEQAGRVDTSRFTGKWITTLRCHQCEGRSDFYWRADPIDVSAGPGNGLRIRDVPAQPIGRLRFRRQDGPIVAFREDASGHVTHMFIRQSVYERYPE